MHFADKAVRIPARLFEAWTSLNAIRSLDKSLIKGKIGIYSVGNKNFLNAFC